MLPGTATLEVGPDLDRILGLAPRPALDHALVERWSRALCPGGTGVLRAPQVETLRECHTLRGVVGPQRVGSGKTLETLLLAHVMSALRPVLVVPASLRAKTRAEWAEYHRAGWLVVLPRIVSYEELGRPDRPNLLAEIDPDLLILDEAHRAANRDSATTRRIERFVRSKRAQESTHGELLVVAVLSGTLIGDDLTAYAHLVVWALGPNAPVPLLTTTQERWATAIDKRTSILRRTAPGRLAEIPGGFHSWLRSRRGVVPTPGSDCTARLVMRPWAPVLSPARRALLDHVRATSMRPDGELLDSWDLPDVLCQIVQDFYYVWAPMPPAWWLLPRRGWLAASRAVLDERIDGLDSEGQLAQYLDRPQPGLLSKDDQPYTIQPSEVATLRVLLASWRAVKDEFVPNPVPVWLDDGCSVLEQAANTDGPTLLWTRHTAAGEGLERLGVPWYPGGTRPEGHDPRETIALMISAHSTGRNLQAWSRSRVLVPMADADAWEQLLGRAHRPGQLAAEVVGEYPDAIDYHRSVMGRVRSQAEATSAASGFDQKLLAAEWQ